MNELSIEQAGDVITKIWRADSDRYYCTPGRLAEIDRPLQPLVGCKFHSTADLRELVRMITPRLVGLEVRHSDGVSEVVIL